MRNAFGIVVICVAFTAVTSTSLTGFAQDKNGPLAELPSKSGPHVEKFSALGDNEWLNLGAPAADPKWGKARGRSWGAKALILVPDKRGAFLFGEGVHGYVKPDGHIMDDLWFYEYDARLDIVVAIHFKENTPGIFVYDPKTSSWADPIPFPVDGPKFHFAANTFFDRELNAYFCHVAGDSSDNGEMWVYRYK